MKGRRNFLCPNRLRQARQQAADLFSSTEKAELVELEKWAQTTKDGSLSDLDFQPNNRVWAQAGLKFELQRLYNPRNRKGLFAMLRDADGVRETTANEAVPGEIDTSAQ